MKKCWVGASSAHADILAAYLKVVAKNIDITVNEAYFTLIIHLLI